MIEDMGIQKRVFDWSSGKNEAGAPSYRFFLDGHEVTDREPLCFAIVSASPGQEEYGILYFYRTDDDGNIVDIIDIYGASMGPARYYKSGKVRWEYA